MSWLFPTLAYAAERPRLEDLAPAQWLPASLFVVILALALPIAFLGRGQHRARRSLALLIALVSTLGALTQLLPLALSGPVSLAVFVALFAVIHLLNRFDSPD